MNIYEEFFLILGKGMTYLNCKEFFDKESIAYEELLFVANLLIPRNLLMGELTRLDARKNVVAELAALFWVPKSLICFQLQEMVKYSQLEMRMTANEVPSASANTHVEMSNI